MKTQTTYSLLKRYVFLPIILIFAVTTIMGTGGGCGDGDDSGGDGGNGGGDGGGGTTSTLVFTANDNIDWVALQDGDGAWSKIEPDVGGGNVYTCTIQDAAGRYGIATHEYVVDDNAHVITVLQGTLAELEDLTLRPTPLTHDITINAANLTASTVFSISRNDIFLSPVVGNDVITADAGTRDLVAIENPGFDLVVPTRGVIIRDIDVSGPTTLDVDIDIDTNVSSFTAHDFNITQYGITYSSYVKFVTANQTRSHGITKGAYDSPDGYYSLDSGTISSDFYSIELQDEFDNSGIESAIEIKRNSSTPDLNFDFTAITPFSGATADTSTIAGLSYTPDPGMPELIGYQIEYAQDRAGESTNDYLALAYIVTPDWLGSSSTYIRPDFSGLTGYDPIWELTSGVTTQVGFTAAMYNVPIDLPLSTHTDWIPDLYMVQPKMRLTSTP